MSKEIMVREYLGSNISFKVVDGEVYANATEMCKAFGKLPSDWMRLKQTTEYVDKLKSDMGNHMTLIEVKKGNTKEYNQGTWIHEKLILDLARWLNVDFRVWMDKTIATLIREGSVSLKPQTEEDLLFQLFPLADETLIRLSADNIRQVKKLKQEIIHKEDVIIGLVENISLAEKRQRISQIIRYKTRNYKDRWNLLYGEFSKKYHVNLNARLDSDYVLSIKPKIKNKLDLIERGMIVNGQNKNMISELYEIAVKLFENDIDELIQEWKETISRI